ncbi:MAG: uracil-DNA glycosylase [Gammaproteobacteria bacterium]
MDRNELSRGSTIIAILGKIVALPATDGSNPDSAAEPEHVLRLVGSELEGCRRCPLHRFRRNIVVGEGNPRAKLVFVGEGPGEEEDAQGRPFVGPAGKLLTRIIQAMDLDRRDVYILNAVKCRPPGNRTPKPEELNCCRPFLQQQLLAISPEIVCTLGTVASQMLLDTQERISQLRGRFHGRDGFLIMPTYHPSYLLRHPESKRAVWEDMKQIMGHLADNNESRKHREEDDKA